MTGPGPNPTLGTSGVTVFSTISGSSTATYAAFTTPVAAIRLAIAACRARAVRLTATVLQAGIG
jgi:hypothetical protein